MHQFKRHMESISRIAPSVPGRGENMPKWPTFSHRNERSISLVLFPIFRPWLRATPFWPLNFQNECLSKQRACSLCVLLLNWKDESSNNPYPTRYNQRHPHDTNLVPTLPARIDPQRETPGMAVSRVSVPVPYTSTLSSGRWRLLRLEEIEILSIHRGILESSLGGLREIAKDVQG